MIADLGLRLATVVRRVAIGLLVVVNVVRSLPVAMLRVVRAAIVGRALRLATAARRVVTGLPAMANVVHSARAMMLRVVRAAIVRLALRLTIEADHVARAMIAVRVRRSATAALRVAIAPTSAS